VSRRPRRSVTLMALIVAAALTLVALTWEFTSVSVDTSQREAQTHAEGNVANLALAVEWQLNRQLQAIDQMMQVLAAQWKADPIHFDPASWKRRSTVLADVSLQVFLLDSAGFVMSSTRPDLIGFDQSDRDYFQTQKASRRAGLFIGPAIRWKATGRWEINLSRRLERDNGSFAGALVVTYDPWAVTNLLEQVDLGSRGLIALVGADGALRALVSPYEVRPGEDISSSAMFRAATAHPQGVWTGPSAPDGVERIHAFRRLADEDLTIVIGVDRKVALRDTQVWTFTARLFAAGISLAIALMALLLLREIRAARGREDRLAQDRAALEAAYAEAHAARASAEAKTAQLEGTLAGMSDGVMLLDPELRVAQWNDRFPAFTGVPREMLRVGVPMEDLLRAQARAGEFGRVDVEAEVRRRMTLLRTFKSVGSQDRTRPNGRSLELRRSALPGGGFVTLYTDITARKQAEEAQAEARRIAEEATEQKSRFVATVSHEIRTPLNAVVNSLALLDQSDLSAPQHRLASTARQAGDALLDLVHDILEMSKVEAGQLALRPGVFDIRHLVTGVADMFRAQAGGRGVRIAMEVTPDVPPHLRADSGRLRQIMMNFVSNAAKFAVPGTVTIRAAITLVGGRPALLLGVRDPGPRIPERDAVQLFQPFSRLSHARDTGTPGTGLGLAICERLTRLMAGQIGLGPSPEGGNEFWLTLPLEVAAPPVVAANDMPARGKRRASLLLVEDIPANQLVTATILRRLGHRVDIAESGPDAIRMAQATPYDLVFMDLVMPGMSGYEAARAIRAMPGPAGAMPIVALTANTADEDRERCIAAGMNDMLGKPVRSAELLAAVNRTIWRPAAVAPLVKAAPAAPAVPLDGPPVDPLRLADLQQGLSPAVLANLVEQCLADFRQRLPLLREALASGDPRAVEANAHALAGMAGTYGLIALDRRMRRTMAAAKLGDVAAAAIAAQDLDAELLRASEAIRGALRATAA